MLSHSHIAVNIISRLNSLLKRLIHFECCHQASVVVLYCICRPYSVFQICSGITSGKVLDGELLYTKILEVNLFAFAYRLFHEDFSPIDGIFVHVCSIILLYYIVLHCVLYNIFPVQYTCLYVCYQLTRVTDKPRTWQLSYTNMQ